MNIPRFFRLQEGWLTVGLLALMLFSVTLSVEQAQWSEYLSILTPITILGLASGIILAKVRGVPRVLLDLIGLNAGIITVLVSVAGIMTDARLVTIQDKIQDLLVRTGVWVGATIRQENAGDDLLVFILSLAVVSWVLAYSSAYFVFRSRQLWWALVPNGVTLLINVSYSSVELRSYVIIFMFSALLLMIRFNLLLQEERWQRERVNYSPALSWGFLWAGSAVSLVLAVAMWFVPETGVNSTLNAFWNQVNRPWSEFETAVGNMWPNVQGGNHAIGGYSSFNDRFTMGGSLNLSDDVALRVKSSERLYWQAVTYDQYNGVSWKNSAPETLTVLPNSSSKLSLTANQQLLSEDKARTAVTYTVEVMHPLDDKLFAASRPIQFSTESRLNVSWRTINDVYDVQSTNVLSVPLELRVLLGALKETQVELQDNGCDPSVSPNDCVYVSSHGSQVRQEIDNLSKRGLNITFDVTPAAAFVMNLRASGEVPVYDDLTAVHAAGAVQKDEQYNVTSLVSGANEDQLRQAGENYDSWVTGRYLSIPATVPQRVRDLAQTITQDAGATNPYDKAKAIEAYLRQNYKYTTQIPVPPSGMDRIDWFLFVGKEGYCEYYASAMTIMLRSVGVPTRLAAGYAPGTYDSKTGVFTVKQSDAHTWPEVYFPGYGWIQFEPTPSQSVVSHQPQAEGTPTVPSSVANSISSPVPPRDPGDTSLNDPNHLGSVGNGGPSGSTFLFTGLVLAALLVLAAVFTWWIPLLPWARKDGSVLNAGFYYSRMLRWARLLGVGPLPHQTPYEFGDMVAREVPGSSMFSRSIAKAYVRERFGSGELDQGDRASVHRSWDALRGRFARALPARQLKRAYGRRRK